jgi:hypothetical protein
LASEDVVDVTSSELFSLFYVLQGWPIEESRHLTLEGFLQYVVDMAKQDVRSAWRALLACGFDFFFER